MKKEKIRKKKKRKEKINFLYIQKRKERKRKFNVRLDRKNDCRFVMDEHELFLGLTFLFL